jgi:hypothetical protein
MCALERATCMLPGVIGMRPCLRATLLQLVLVQPSTGPIEEQRFYSIWYWQWGAHRPL